VLIQDCLFSGKTKNFGKSIHSSERKKWALKKLQHIVFFSSNPDHFWYLYGQRYNLYKKTNPHAGYKKLLTIAEALKGDNYFVYTPNIDGHFLKAGFPHDHVMECHGSMFYFQCFYCNYIQENQDYVFMFDHYDHTAQAYPTCHKCEAPLRPNVLLYKDNFRLPERQDEQMANFNNFNQNNAKKSVCIIEIGAGVSMKGLRKIGDSYLADDSHKATLIRINPKYESIALHDLLQRVRKDELTKEDASNFDFVGGVGERSLFENSEDFNMEEVIH